MTAKIIDGKAIAQKVRDKIKTEINRRFAKGAPPPGLAVVLVGNNIASKIYVKNKSDACQECGIISTKYNLPSNITEKELLSLIIELNINPTINGILIQLPLPSHICAPLILQNIDPKKDVDGFHPINLGLLAQGQPYLRPCTPYGVMYLLEHEKIHLSSLHAVVVGTSNIVGKPMAFELLNAGCTVTLCHSKTRDLEKHVNRADLLVSAIGKSGIIKSEWIKPNAVVIDIGITRSATGIQGDIEFDSAKQRAGYITPVPGGVGPMTVAMLLANTLLAAANITTLK